MKSILNFLVTVLVITGFSVGNVSAQGSANPAVTGAVFVPNTIEVDQTSLLTFSFSNAGFSEIPVGSIQISVSTSNSFYSTDGISAPTGTAASLFNWVYISDDFWQGTNTAEIFPMMGGTIEFTVTGELESTNAPTNINVQPISDFGSFNDSPIDNNLQPELTVVPASGCTDPTPEVSGDFFVCANQVQEYFVDTPNIVNQYMWSLSGGGVLTENGSSASVEWGTTPGSYLLTLIEGTPEGCATTVQYNVVIEDDIILVCNDNLNISLANNCELTITPDIILEAPLYEDDSYSIVVKDEDGNIVSNVIDHNYINQTLEVSVTHICSGNTCWGDITIEDKLKPVLACENDTLTCDEYQSFIPTANLVSDNCQNATITYEIEEMLLNCDPEFSRKLTVTFNAVDESGNEAVPCISTIYVEKEFISDIALPISYDGLAGNNLPLSCSGNYPVNSLGHPDPSFTGTPGGLNNCSSIEWTYTDVNLPLCGGTSCAINNPSYKVIREWVIVDWCTGEIFEYQQIIKVEDNLAPEINFIPDLTANVNPYDCSAQILLPIAVATDNCSADEGITYSYETEIGVINNGVLSIDSPAKTMDDGITVTVYATDCCGNESSISFQVEIVDNTPPVVVADSHETISLLPSGSATLYATSIDDGSYDNCGPIGLFVKRMDNGSGLPSVDLFPPAGNDNSQYNEVVHFFCSDIPNNPIMVQFRVCDDANMDGTIGNNGDNCNDAMVEVEVQDKYVPVIQCPPNMTISCTEFAEVDLENDDELNALFGEVSAAATCGVEIDQVVFGSEELECGEGFISRNFTATNSAGQQNCSQTIVVQAFDDNLLTCDRIQFSSLNNNIYNWCAVNDNNNDNDDDLPSIDVDGCEGIDIAELDINQNGLCTTVGVQITIDTFVYASSSACKKYIVHYEVIDQCLFEENYVDPNTGQINPFFSDNGYFEFYLEYNVVDSEAPELVCEQQVIDSDVCEGFSGSISIEANDACTPGDQLYYEWKLDVGADGFVDLPLNGGYFTGNSVTGSAIGLTAIPEGDHIILWRVNDGCGNFETCSQFITINPETKEPTPYCLGEISTAVMPSTGSIDIWANDFDLGSQDNCTPVTLTMIPEVDVEGLSDSQAYQQSFNHSNVTIQSNGDYGFSFDCSYIPNGITAMIEVRIYVTDEHGNYDYCTSVLRIDDNFDACLDLQGTLTIGGNIITKTGEGISNVGVSLDAMFPEFPINDVTDEFGGFAFNSLHANIDYTVTPEKNDDPLNGISTLDIVLIQKHILGLDIIINPYLRIAADVNSDCNVTGLDIVQLRKLILGKYPDDAFPDNTSWRFVIDEFDLPFNEQPCVYDEISNIDMLNSSETADFTGVKIGDINESAESNFTGNADTRTFGTLDLNIVNSVISPNETYSIPFTVSSSEKLYGYQFAMKLGNLEFVNINSDMFTLSESNYVISESNEIWFSVDLPEGINVDADDVLFTLEVSSSTRTNLKDELVISSSRLNAEAYIGDNLTVYTPEIVVRDENDNEIANESFKLYQNEPNPFIEYTNIAFTLPKTSEAILSIYSFDGKLIYQKTNVYKAGYNILKVMKDDLPGKGVFYYTVECGNDMATKKMIIIE